MKIKSNLFEFEGSPIELLILNYHKIYDKNILSKSNLIAVYYLNPQSISLAEVETDILEGNQFEINIHHNLK